MKFKVGDEVIVTNPQFIAPVIGTPGRVVDCLRSWSELRGRILHEYGVKFEGHHGSFSVEEEDLAFNGPLDRLAREAQE